MQNRTNPIRRHSRFPVSWPVLYGNDALLAEGTVLDLTALGWRVAGTMPVAPGMELTLRVSVPERSTPLRVHRATVLWVKNHEFAIEAHEMPPMDQAWVNEFLRQKLGLMWISRTTDHETSLQAGDEPRRSDTAVSQPAVPSVEDILHRFSAIDLASTGMPAPARQSDDSDFQKDEVHSSGDYMPEKILHEAHRIVRRMIAIKSARVRTGRNPIPDN